MLAGLVIVIPVAYWLASPLFINVRVNESLPPAVITNLSTVSSGSFADADSFHRTSGTAAILQAADGSRFVRLTEFRTTNGPDLFLVLAADKSGKDLLYLGALKGNIGDQNYAIPQSTDLARYSYVLVWCRAFSVLFGSAQLSK